MSMIRKYHNHKLQTTPWHREEEPLNHHIGHGYMYGIAKPFQEILIFFMVLTHLSRIEYPTVINWNGQFPILGVLGGTFHIFSKFQLKKL